MKKTAKRLLILHAVAVTASATFAGSASWSSNPVSSDWNTAANWVPATIPNTQADTARFGTSSVTNLTVGEWSDGSGQTDTMVRGIVFAPGADPYTITVTPVPGAYPSILEIFIGGIRNNSGVMQNFVAASSGTWEACARIYFNSFGSAGENVTITNQGGDSADGDSTYGAFTSFEYNSSAGRATLVNEGSTAANTIFGGSTALLFQSSAESATFINNPGTVSGAAAGHTLIQTFSPGGNLGTSTFIANPATVPGAEGGWVEMDVGTCAGTSFIANGATVADCQAGQIYVYGAEYGTGLGVASFTGNGGNGTNAQGGLIDVFNLPLSDQTMVTANAGTNGGLGGTILIEGEPPLDVPQFQVFGNGTLDLINATSDIAIGSLSGSGIVLLDGHTLTVGSNNFDTIFSGVMQESGGLTKAGTGTLTLSGANTYSGTTTVTAGTLRIRNQTGSATGTGPVKVQAGTLGGKGTISGAVTIGTGSGPGAVLAPSTGGQVAILTLQRSLTFKADGTYSYRLNTNNGRADQVIARNVTIESGAEFSFQSLGNRRLPSGTLFTVISNTSANPITGTFANLPDGSTFAAGRNTYQVSYEGGDGNDLTLTVVP
jgi:autotransporter-associated beta strand protein